MKDIKLIKENDVLYIFYRKSIDKDKAIEYAKSKYDLKRQIETPTYKVARAHFVNQFIYDCITFEV